MAPDHARMLLMYFGISALAIIKLVLKVIIFHSFMDMSNLRILKSGLMNSRPERESVNSRKPALYAFEFMYTLGVVHNGYLRDCVLLCMSHTVAF